jgi:hypothetical protein
MKIYELTNVFEDLVRVLGILEVVAKVTGLGDATHFNHNAI